MVLVSSEVFDGISDALTGAAEKLVEGNRIARMPPRAQRRQAAIAIIIILKLPY
jgi:hypothetical protein